MEVADNFEELARNKMDEFKQDPTSQTRSELSELLYNSATEMISKIKPPWYKLSDENVLHPIMKIKLLEGLAQAELLTLMENRSENESKELGLRKKNIIELMKILPSEMSFQSFDSFSGLLKKPDDKITETRTIEKISDEEDENEQEILRLIDENEQLRKLLHSNFSVNTFLGKNTFVLKSGSQYHWENMGKKEYYHYLLGKTELISLINKYSDIYIEGNSTKYTMKPTKIKNYNISYPEILLAAISEAIKQKIRRNNLLFS